MKYKLLPIALLFAINCSRAQTNMAFAYAKRPKGTAAFYDSYAYTAKATAIMPKPAPPVGNGGGSVHLFESVSLGYASAATNAAGVSIKGGFLYSAEMGVKFELPTHNENRSSMLSVSLSPTGYSIKRTYKDNTGATKSDKYTFALITMPISYTRVRSSINESRPLFYWEAGVNINYVAEAKLGDKKAKDQFNSIFIGPFIGTGFGTRYHIIGGRSDGLGGVVLMGPFAGYNLTNMSNSSSATLNSFTIGMRWIMIGGI